MAHPLVATAHMIPDNAGRRKQHRDSMLQVQCRIEVILNAEETIQKQTICI